MIIVCLDQCAISGLARGSDGPVCQLREMLLQSAGELKLLCPLAPETIVETTGLKSAERRLSIYDLHCRLADARLGGPVWAFKSMWKMIKEETLALARSESPPSALELIQWNRAEDDTLAAKTWDDISHAKERMAQRVQSHPLNRVEGKPTLDLTSRGIILEHAAHIYRQIQRLLSDEPLDPKDHMGYEVAQYLEQNVVSKGELRKLVQDILHHRWEAIPVIFNRTQLAGQLEADFRSERSPRSYNVNDELDISRLAVGLWVADVVITDAAMAQVCRSAKVETWNKAKVFAVRDSDKILAQLELLLAH